ncbi:DnaJ domain containing protein, putative [Angomonas deanei]|uniref:DnaJ domain containing protein, putative n=1 Tax=Angomonas deanei TaxID=59799 RepID=A0A7G2C3J2_9TRYP|nr:DnaJ domain containing protein, putative [Angomonas deanei]
MPFEPQKKSSFSGNHRYRHARSSSAPPRPPVDYDVAELYGVRRASANAVSSGHYSAPSRPSSAMPSVGRPGRKSSLLSGERIRPSSSGAPREKEPFLSTKPTHPYSRKLVRPSKPAARTGTDSKRSSVEVFRRRSDAVKSAIGQSADRASSSKEVRVLQEESQALMAQGDARLGEGQLQEAAQQYTAGIEVFMEHPKSVPAEDGLAHLAHLHYKRSLVYRQQFYIYCAIADCKVAMLLLDKIDKSTLLRDREGSFTLIHLVIRTNWQLANCFVYLGKWMEANQYYTVAAEWLRHLRTPEKNTTEFSFLSVEYTFVSENANVFSSSQYTYREGLEALQRWNDWSLLDDSVRCWTRLPFLVKEVERTVPISPSRSLVKLKVLVEKFPEYAHLYYLNAKAMFYLAHDSVATINCLSLLKKCEALSEREKETHDEQRRRLSLFLRQSLLGQTAEQLDLFMERHKVMTDSRSEHLKHAIKDFVTNRDEGNQYYRAGDWQNCYRCYSNIIARNKPSGSKKHTEQSYGENASLLSVTYSNRSAVCMQWGRWDQALDDINDAIQYHMTTAAGCTTEREKNSREIQAKLCGRRSRIYTRLAEEGEDRKKCEAYFKGAIQDLELIHTLFPTAENLEKVKEAERLRDETLSNIPRQGSGYRPTTPQSNFYNYAEQGERRRMPKVSCADDSDEENTYPVSRLRGNSKIKTYMELLNLPITGGNSDKITSEAVNKAYRVAALRWHPDRWVNASKEERAKAEDHFKQIVVAYQELGALCTS